MIEGECSLVVRERARAKRLADEEARLERERDAERERILACTEPLVQRVAALERRVRELECKR